MEENSELKKNVYNSNGMNNFINYLIIISIFGQISCDYTKKIKGNNANSSDQEARDGRQKIVDPLLNLREESIAVPEPLMNQQILEIYKVDLAKKIEPFISDSIDKKWTKSDWVNRFGQPLRSRVIGDDIEYLEYLERGPYPPKGKKIVSGVLVVLRAGVTTECNWHYTHFGNPEDWK